MAMQDWNGDGKIDSYDDYAESEGLYHSDVAGGLNNVHSDYSHRSIKNSSDLENFKATYGIDEEIDKEY